MAYSQLHSPYEIPKFVHHYQVKEGKSNVSISISINISKGSRIEVYRTTVEVVFIALQEKDSIVLQKNRSSIALVAVEVVSHYQAVEVAFAEDSKASHTIKDPTKICHYLQ
ncbi:hypothetical protein DPMN_176727, partial [Dreissena polymorpha]